ncbi:MAG: hypothetical protein IT181_13165 [Acidobacteria bacterium]|nr:hypothetical protein [Acidobacteriota bacterium]
MGQTYQFPELPAGQFPQSLVPEDQAGQKDLKPDTPVVIVNRGLGALRDKFDGRDYVIPPGPQTFLVPYGAALHFQKRNIVPGTRTLGEGGFESFIGILNIDSPENCLMLNDAEYAAAMSKPEGLDRSQLDPERQNVRALQTSAQRGQVAGQGMRRTVVDRGNREDVFTPPPGGFMGTQALVDEAGQQPDLDDRERPENTEPPADAKPQGRRR